MRPGIWNKGKIAEKTEEKIAEGIFKDIFPLLFSKDSVLYSKEKKKGRKT